MAKGLLAVAFDFSTAHADEFHDWYDLEHIPERQAVPGFGACERWLSADQPNYAAATYDLDSLDVLRGDAYRAIAYDNLSVWSKRVTGMCSRLLRFEGTQINPGDAPAPENAGGLLINAINVDAQFEQEFNAWYDEEHIPALSSVPGTLAARRFKADPGSPSTHGYIAAYHLESADVTRGEAWRTAVDTPWTMSVRKHFKQQLRILTGRYVRAG